VFLRCRSSNPPRVNIFSVEMSGAGWRVVVDFDEACSGARLSKFRNWTVRRPSRYVG
jgi:hypothetical protein